MVALTALAALTAVGPAPARADCPGDSCLSLVGDVRGNVDFFATGGSFTVDDDADDRPDAVLDEGRVVVPGLAVPPRATLRRAWIYFGGSLYDDGDGRTIDREVEIQVPGAPDRFEAVRGEVVYASSVDLFPNLQLYTVRADVTDILRAAGGPLTGTYRVRGFDADVFDGSLEHTAANASFSLVLLYEEPRLPPREVFVFDGLELVLGSTVTLDIDGFRVSRVPSGSLTVYAQEGDCHPGPDACASGDNRSGLEQIRVIGADGARRLVLSDDVNPPNDVFNRTINTVTPPLTGVVGTDIDGFDISPVLRAGDERATIEVTAPAPRAGNRGELVGLVYVIAGIDVFAPELAVDSRIEVRSDAGDVRDAFFAGDPLEVTVALSNTGNTPAESVSAVLELPDDVVGFEVGPLPETATVTVDRAGGAAGRGRLDYAGLRVRHGEITGLPITIDTRCPRGASGVLTLTATVSGDGVAPFVVTTTAALAARDRCGPRFNVQGGGGCRGAGGDLGWALLVAVGVIGVALRRRRLGRAGRGRGGFVFLAAFAGGNLACGDDVGPADRDPPAPLGTPCPERAGMVLVPSVRGGPPFCIDQYEARVQTGALGAPVQPAGGDGSTTAIAGAERFAFPSRGVTWHQAAAICRNSGKRLCSDDEWRIACAGPDDATFPYGDDFAPGRCNGFSAGRGDVVQTGAMIEPVITDAGQLVASGCVSPFGVYDLSGNLWEWTATPFLGGAQRGLVGGSYRSNADGLRCVNADASEDPGVAEPTVGFRCCVDAP